MGDRYTTAAVAAAVEVGQRFRLPAEHPEVLATRSNVLVRLGAVVARVPGTTLVARPGVLQSLAREVALSSFLEMRDAPVVPPFESPGPHVANGLPVTLWRFTRHDPDHVFSPGEVAWSLAELHAALRDFPGALDTRGPLAEARSWIARFDLPAELADEVDALEAVLPEARAQALHGDAHPGNLLATASGPRWVDFEDTWAGPVAWDLACLALTSRLDGRAAVAAYPDAPDPDELAPWVRLRDLFGVCWRFAIARRFPERLPEAQADLRRFKTVGGSR
ncbi:phosphotransferase family protein [Amycolatopsis tucumanensis]|uniref:Aminoglycoside phosphotransferase family protein n=1 Tax=Amycolatopsis tucumanensis TaxID=401106 RepID=A0ABP7JWY1_9PSEU|nr:phosphotransferase [Amycolatopsis tucumanensis]MCF6428575.1 phosphotransferase [Amycolatopsis tucumanensis]